MESYKKSLRAFALEVSGRAHTKGAARAFVEGLMACFGWEQVPGQLDCTLELGGGESHDVGLWWPERKVLIDVRKPYVMLQAAWPELLKTCLAPGLRPRYVVFTNRRELQLYDTKKGREAPILNIDIEELPKYSEALAFLTRDWEPSQGLAPIVDVAQVSEQVASRVGVLYRSLLASGTPVEDAVHYVLQCITAMFAEDVGLLPKDAFTRRLYEAASGRASAQELLADLFGQMATRPSAPREIRYFNGGLFCDPVSLDLTEEQLRTLTKASESNWTQVDPHIFGSVFEGIMSDQERHATGAHYTAREDIMLVVGPTIVEPWRRRIQDAKTLTDLKALREELGAFRVLDPACGSGNFLYVSYRELYRLETELLSRMRNEFPASQGKISWVSAIKTTNFYGIDINPFAVELARTTLNIAKKIAFDERHRVILDLYGQTELATDPSLPLDNLNDNVVCADALFMEWPEADAIIGNPPFLGGQKIRHDIGDEEGGPHCLDQKGRIFMERHGLEWTVEIDHGGSLAAQRAVRPRVVVVGEVAGQSREAVVTVFVLVEVDLLILDATPQALDPHVVQRATLAVHAHPDPALVEHRDEARAGELRPLVRVEDLGLSCSQRFMQGTQTELHLQRVRQLPAEHVA